MRNRSIGLGISLLSVGIIWALINSGVLSWSIVNAFFVLWPLILVVAGVNIIFRSNEIVKAVTWVLFLCILAAYSYFIIDARPSSQLQQNGLIYEDKKSGTKRGELDLSLGGLKLDLNSGTQRLIEASASTSDIRYDIAYKDGDATALIKIDKKSYFPGIVRSDGYKCDIRLNRDVIWDMNIKTGAVDGILDATGLMLNKLDVGIGAGKLKIILGDNQGLTRLNIDAGVSKIDIEVPENVGVRARVNGALNRTNFGGLGWEKRDEYYYSPNYNQAGSTVEINLNMGLGDFNIETGRQTAI